MVLQYRLETVCTGHQKLVNDIVFDPTGSMMASSGDDHHVIIWDCHTGEPSQEVLIDHHGPVTSLLWVTNNYATARGGDSLLFIGCADGLIHGYNYDNPTGLLRHIETIHDQPHEIQSLEYDPHKNWVAFSVGKLCRVYNLQADCSSPQFQVHDKNAVACSVHFLNMGEMLLVLFMETHEVIKLIVGTGDLQRVDHLINRIGTSATSSDGMLLLVGNLKSGVELYDMDTMACIATFEQPICGNVPKQVRFIHGGRLMIGGSDHGLVHIWNREDKLFVGHPLILFLNPNCDSSAKHLVQTIRIAFLPVVLIRFFIWPPKKNSKCSMQ
ncbi:WD40 repeat-like protein [Ramaria rubella]|nr:WD40 repeat-like protein [Ramaria rubella]